MTQNTRFITCPIPTANGADCWRLPHPDSKLHMCVEHLRMAARDWATPIPESPLFRCQLCNLFTVRESIADDIRYCLGCGRIQKSDHHQPIVPDDLGEWAVQLDQWRAEAEFRYCDVIYYLRWGDRIKIGTTRDLRTRMGNLYHDELLAIEPGEYKLERQRHDEFADARFQKYREWFHVTPELRTHINLLRSIHGEPYAAVDRWMAEKRAKAAA